MSTSKLKLNPDKTEFLLIGNERQRSKYLSMFPIELLGVETYPAKSARNLGVIFDKNFNFCSHIFAISKALYHTCFICGQRCKWWSRQPKLTSSVISDIKPIIYIYILYYIYILHFTFYTYIYIFFTFTSVVHVFTTSRIYGVFAVTLIWKVQKLLANALVSSRLNYCDSLLSGIAENDLSKLQGVSKRLARVVTKSPPFTRNVPLLRSLHWLPVKYRVHFKICLLTYKALH